MSGARITIEELHDLAHGRILELGRRLAVGEVLVYGEGAAEPVVHVTSTYSIPPGKR